MFPSKNLSHLIQFHPFMAVSKHKWVLVGLVACLGCTPAFRLKKARKSSSRSLQVMSTQILILSMDA